MKERAKVDYSVQQAQASQTLRTLSANLTALMKATPEFGTHAKLGKKAGVDQKTVWRIENRLHEPSIDKVEKIAKVFGLKAWQMLVPSLNPKAEPQLADARETETSEA